MKIDTYNPQYILHACPETFEMNLLIQVEVIAEH